MSSVYPPKEDSYLLAEAVKKHAYGNVLDVGTGSGIQAISAANSGKVEKVTAIDINPEALGYAKKHNTHKKIIFIESDLFSNLRKTELFDTIIFNPPYLPDDERVKDLALDGGKKGYELTVRFLEVAKDYLKNDGQILLLFSSYTKKEVIDSCLKENLYAFESVSDQKIDFETLYVYKITKNALLKRLEGYKKIRLFAKGKRGVVYCAEKGKKRYAIKTKREGSDAVSTLDHEGSFLKIVNELGIGPKLLSYDSDQVIMEFIDGIRIQDFFEKETKKEIIKILIKTLEQIRILDLNNIQKQEMSNPYKHILVTKDKKVFFIDFERARKKPLPANLTQFLDFLISNKTASVLKSKKILLDKQEILDLSKAYKHEQTKNNYKKITDYIRGL